LPEFHKLFPPSSVKSALKTIEFQLWLVSELEKAAHHQKDTQYDQRDADTRPDNSEADDYTGNHDQKASNNEYQPSGHF
jgi:hypothetical protein